MRKHTLFDSKSASEKKQTHDFRLKKGSIRLLKAELATVAITPISIFAYLCQCDRTAVLTNEMSQDCLTQSQ